jgi:ABC-type transporter Mla MlaB component
MVPRNLVATNRQEPLSTSIRGQLALLIQPGFFKPFFFNRSHSWRTCPLFGTPPALVKASGGEQAVLRISIISDSDQVIACHLEGRLAGPWVDELRRIGDEAFAQKKTLTLDLEGVRFADHHGIALLQEFSRLQVSQLNYSQFLIQQMKELTR